MKHRGLKYQSEPSFVGVELSLKSTGEIILKRKPSRQEGDINSENVHSFVVTRTSSSPEMRVR